MLKENFQKIKRNKKYRTAFLFLVVVVVALTGLVTNKVVNIDKYRGKVNVSNVEVTKPASEKEEETTKKEDTTKPIEEEQTK